MSKSALGLDESVRRALKFRASLATDSSEQMNFLSGKTENTIALLDKLRLWKIRIHQERTKRNARIYLTRCRDLLDAVPVSRDYVWNRLGNCRALPLSAGWNERNV